MRIGVDQYWRSEFLIFPHQKARHLQRDQPAKGITGELIRTSRLTLTHMVEIERRHLLDRFERRLPAVESRA